MASAVGSILVGKAATAGAAASAGILGFGGKVSAMAVIGTGLSLVSGMAARNAALEGAYLQARGLNDQADLLDLQARNVRLEGESDANQIRAAMLRTVAANDATYAARGIDIGGGGTPQDARVAAIREGEENIQIARSSAESRALQREIDARSKRNSARYAVRAGKTGATAALVGSAGSLVNRSLDRGVI